MIAFLAKTFSGAQLLLRLEPEGRRLTGDEIAVLETVFRDTVDYSDVLIKEGRIGAMGASGRAFTLCNTIYIPGLNGSGYGPPGSDGYLRLLVHEVVHIWQFQNGGTDYITASVTAQLGGWWRGKGMSYAYRYERGIKEGLSWEQLGPEQQAKLIEDAYAHGFFSDPNAQLIGSDGETYTGHAKVAVEELRARRGAA
jgi:hypothetical protein